MDFRFLTNDFFADHSHCTEMERKANRPYACMCLIEIGGVHFAIPIRHHINHPHAVFTDKNKTQGLDLSKAVVITDLNRYIDTTQTAYIDANEYLYLSNKKYFVKQKLLSYIEKYKKALQKRHIPRNDQLCRMSCLQYFHKELGI